MYACLPALAWKSVLSSSFHHDTYTHTHAFTHSPTYTPTHMHNTEGHPDKRPVLLVPGWCGRTRSFRRMADRLQQEVSEMNAVNLYVPAFVP